MQSRTKCIVTAATVAVCVLTLRMAMAADAPQAAEQRVFEMRIYTAAEGKLDALNARFRDHTNGLFKKHGMEVIGYWVPTDEPRSKNTLIYILAYPSREAAAKSWDAFRKDPEWIKARAESEKDGRLVDKAESIYMNPTDYSVMK